MILRDFLGVIKFEEQSLSFTDAEWNIYRWDDGRYTLNNEEMGKWDLSKTGLAFSW